MVILYSLPHIGCNKSCSALFADLKIRSSMEACFCTKVEGILCQKCLHINTLSIFRKFSSSSAAPHKTTVNKNAWPGLNRCSEMLCLTFKTARHCQRDFEWVHSSWWESMISVNSSFEFLKVLLHTVSLCYFIKLFIENGKHFCHWC